MMAEIITQPDNSLFHYVTVVLGWILTTFVSGWFGYRWGQKSQIFGKKLEIKLVMLPMIERFANRAKSENTAAWSGLRPDSIAQLFEPAEKLKNLLCGRKRKLFTKAWECFYNTTPDEFHIPQHEENADQENQMRQLFLNRINALKKIVDSV